MKLSVATARVLVRVNGIKVAAIAKAFDKNIERYGKGVFLQYLQHELGRG